MQSIRHVTLALPAQRSSRAVSKSEEKWRNSPQPNGSVVRSFSERKQEISCAARASLGKESERSALRVERQIDPQIAFWSRINTDAALQFSRASGLRLSA
jgi:hypothetical protein